MGNDLERRNLEWGSALEKSRVDALIKFQLKAKMKNLASIIQVGVDINASSRVQLFYPHLAGVRAIGVAIRSGNKAIIKLLVKAEADEMLWSLGSTFYENATEEMQEIYHLYIPTHPVSKD